MNDKKETGIPQTPDGQRELLKKLFDPEAGGKLGEADIRAMTESFGDKAREAAKPQDRELAPYIEKRLRASFDENIAMWDSLGVFTPEREAKGFTKPNFDEYKAAFARYQEFTQPGRSNELDKGYDMVNFVPMDIPLVSEDPKEQTLFLMLEKTLKEEFAREGEDKPANSLVIKTRRGKRMVLTEKQVDLNEILSVWKKEYWSRQIAYKPLATLARHVDGSYFSESEMHAHDADIEKKNGGFMRLERSAIILPQDIGQERMSGSDWLAEKGKSIPKGVELQTAHDGMAFMIHYIKTHHHISDACTRDEKTSQFAVMPEAFFPDLGNSALGASAYFVVDSGRFCLTRGDAGIRSFGAGVRAGVRIN